MSDHSPDAGKKVRTAAEIICCPHGCQKDEIASLRGECHASGFQRSVDSLHAAGLMIVPREPTKEQFLAGPARGEQAVEESMYHGIYRAMTSKGEVK